MKNFFSIVMTPEEKIRSGGWKCLKGVFFLPVLEEFF